jgi:hypothetical protein
MREWLVGLCLACASACTTSGYMPSDAGESDAAISGNGGNHSDDDDDDDRDHDGVCNGTELALMSDPDRADTDRDGFPDYTEVMANLIPTNPSIPGPEQIVYLDGSAASTIDFEVRMTVDGSGLGYTGEFRPDASPDPRGISAKDFYLGAEALGGQPLDNVRGVQPASERFESVLGKTRVSFQLHFAVGTTKVAGCTIGYPFEYRLKDDNGRFGSSRGYMLVVTSGLNAKGEHTYCVPASCI